RRNAGFRFVILNSVFLLLRSDWVVTGRGHQSRRSGDRRKRRALFGVTSRPPAGPRPVLPLSTPVLGGTAMRVLRPSIVPLLMLALALALPAGPRPASAQPYTLTTLASFNGANGNGPVAGVTLDAHGNLFGTTEFGGASDRGAVFELAAGSGTITTLASFN